MKILLLFVFIGDNICTKWQSESKFKQLVKVHLYAPATNCTVKKHFFFKIKITYKKANIVWSVCLFRFNNA